MANIYPVVQKTVKKTVVTFGFIRELDGQFVEQEVQTKDYARSITKNKATLELQREFPDETVRVSTIKTENIRYTMDSSKFMELADKEILVDEPKQTELHIEETV